MGILLVINVDTQEMYYSTRRQQFLIDQVYAFKVITHLDQLEDVLEMVHKSRDEQIELLMSVRRTYKSDVEL